MHLLTILAFALLFWRAELSGPSPLLLELGAAWTLAFVWCQPLLLGVIAWASTRRVRSLADDRSLLPEKAQLLHHRVGFGLRLACVAGFGASVFLTRWPEWFAFERTSPLLQIVGDLIVLSPYVFGLLMIWIVTYPAELLLRSGTIGAGHESSADRWQFTAYLDFHVRHYLLIVAVPMALILFTANVTRGYSEALQRWSGWAWTPDVLLGAAAVSVFVTAPMMLRRIWRTVPLPVGPVRTRLEGLCDRIGLRCREILVWHSDGMMINAAVMGISPRVRYVLLSDALLEAMDGPQVEAVFGHEAGHVHHRHMQHFLLFAAVGWLLVAGVMELAGRQMQRQGTITELRLFAVEGIGIVLTLVIWGIGFGWLSRRFERQADLFGARSVTPIAERCRMPCSVHPDDGGTPVLEGRVCMTAASVFASALDRVAVLNGIPHEEWSWRHSSIASRIRFLMSMAGDPSRVRRFEHVVRRAKITMLAAAAVGVIVSVYYWIQVTEPILLRVQAGLP